MNQILMMMHFLKVEEVFEWSYYGEIPRGETRRYVIRQRSESERMVLIEGFDHRTGETISAEVDTLPASVLKRIHARLYTTCKTAMTPTAMAILVRGELQKIGITGKLDEPIEAIPRVDE